ncbi:MAG: hypothetical protein P8N54_01740, partial [Flavobacteriales bacterium]|nr:hypothetical protein [Flavobacteriales bacterium]
MKTFTQKSIRLLVLIFISSFSLQSQSLEITNIDFNQFHFQGNTGSNLTVMLVNSTIIDLMEGVSGEAILGAFYDLNNDDVLDLSSESVGSTTISSVYQTSLALWGDDCVTSNIDGLPIGETPVFYILNEFNELYFVEFDFQNENTDDLNTCGNLDYTNNNYCQTYAEYFGFGYCYNQIFVSFNSTKNLINQDSQNEAQCDLPPSFEGNTGSNMTVMLLAPFINSLNVTNPDAYLVALSADGSVVGSKVVAGISQTVLTVWGDDSTTDQTDGALAQEAISFQLVDGDGLFDVVMPSPVVYSTNNMVPQLAAAVLSDACISGCTNSLACNFNSLAIQDDGSCSIPGCTDNNYIEYFNQGFEAGCEDGSCSIEVKDFDLSPQNFQVQNITGNSMNIGFNSLSISNIESATIGAFYDLNGDGIINTDTYTNDTGETYSECVGLTDFNVDEFFTLALWGDNSSTNEVDGLIEGQSEVIFAILTQNNQVIVFDLLPEFPSYSSNGIIVSNGIELDVRLYGCTDPSYCSYDPNAEEDDGSCNGIPGCLDLFYTEYDIDANCNKQEL